MSIDDRVHLNGPPGAESPGASGDDPTPPADPAAASGLPSRLPPAQPVVPPRRKLDLSLAALPQVGDLQPVQQLGVREFKGVGSQFTAHIDSALAFHGLVHQPPGEYETHYQIIAGDLLKDPRIVRLAKRIAFIPVYAWSAFEVALMPLKVTTFGQRVIADLTKLRAKFPLYKAFVTWDAGKKRHVVYEESLSPGEAELIGGVAWPSREEIAAALEVTAFDDLTDLMAANEEVHTLLTAREVGS